MGNSQSTPPDEHQHQHTRAHSHPTNKPPFSSQQPRKNPPLSNPPRAPAVIPIPTSASTSTSNTHAHATVTHSSLPLHGRARSSTTAAPSLIPISDVIHGQKMESSSVGTNPAPVTTMNPPKEAVPISSPPTQPVDVPLPANQSRLPIADETNLSSSLSHADYSLIPSDYSRPPRLPLPIEEEVHSPGSPIITPQDLNTELNSSGVEGQLPRRTSVLSSTTVDDEDVGDVEALDVNSLAPTVPTKIEWRGPGEKIYVTGTFVNWERKFKLHKSPDKTQDRTRFSATLQLKPGTHHIKFLVDGDMITSEDLPTTVDYTNILVNYIEVIAPLPPALVRPPTPAKPIDIPGATHDKHKSARASDSSILAKEARGDSKSTADLVAKVPPIDRKQDLETTTSKHVGPPLQQPPPTASAAKPATPAKQKRPRPSYSNQIPEYLHDLDVHTNPEDEKYQRANRVITILPQPPTLPMIMNKSILNMTTPHKDDASVLNMPNHTILNHLATSSIKSGVLATSGTTRYKRKFLTTIMFKPTSDDG